jgi:hypothetical protein
LVPTYVKPPPNLDFLRERNHNVIRLWAWEQVRWAPWSDGKGQNPSDWFIGPSPYARSGPGRALDGRPKFDLEKWDDAYFDRLRARERMAGAIGAAQYELDMVRKKLAL